MQAVVVIADRTHATHQHQMQRQVAAAGGSSAVLRVLMMVMVMVISRNSAVTSPMVNLSLAECPLHP
ncbi:MAG: hypothetical protein NTV57_16585 [Cyanobacteria bacterium]|nr:hypothetical protein [Cyanobacteriota bacterium]